MANVLVTGTDSRLGATLATGLAEAGHTVAAGSPDGAWPQGMSGDLELEPVRLSLAADHAAMEAGLEDVRRTLGWLDWVVVLGRTGPLVPVELLPTDVLESTVAMNLVGPIRLIRDLIPDLRQSSDGRIVAISSLAGATGLPASAACSAARAGLEAALDALRYELLPDDIKVAVIQAVDAIPSIGHDLVESSGESHYGPLLDTAGELRHQASRWADDGHVLDEVVRALEADRPAFRTPVGAYAALAAEIQDGSATPSDVVNRLYRLDEWLIQAGPPGSRREDTSPTGPSGPDGGGCGSGAGAPNRTR